MDTDTYRLPLMFAPGTVIGEIVEHLPDVDGPALTGDAPLGDNERRAGFAAAAALAYAEATGLTGEDMPTVLRDLCNDLRHLCDTIADGEADAAREDWRRLDFAQIAGDPLHYADEIGGH